MLVVLATHTHRRKQTLELKIRKKKMLRLNNLNCETRVNVTPSEKLKRERNVWIPHNERLVHYLPFRREKRARISISDRRVCVLCVCVCYSFSVCLCAETSSTTRKYTLFCVFFCFFKFWYFLWMDEAATVIQAYTRGYLARKRNRDVDLIQVW